MRHNPPYENSCCNTCLGEEKLHFLLLATQALDLLVEEPMRPEQATQKASSHAVNAGALSGPAKAAYGTKAAACIRVYHSLPF